MVAQIMMIMNQVNFFKSTTMVELVKILTIVNSPLNQIKQITIKEVQWTVITVNYVLVHYTEMQMDGKDVVHQTELWIETIVNVKEG